MENQEPRAGAPGVSRAINIDDSLQVVSDLCKQHAIGISTIEALDSGGTRVVLNTVADAENLRRRVKGKLIQASVVRSSLHIARQAPKY